jgi:serine phosphatase RsbU (regulator of sigma subunit)
LIASSTPPLGLVEQPQFEETAVQLERGDAFILYTDGLFGGAEDNRNRLTPESLAQIVDGSASSAEAVLASILRKILPADSRTRLADDLAAIAVQRRS